MSSAFAAFEDKWLSRLNTGANTRFVHGSMPEGGGLYFAIADGFVSASGFSPIGFNWELLDTSGDPSAVRSAHGEVVKALSNRISDYGRPWLARDEAVQCASDFFGLFDPADLTVVSNRYDGLWNPISGAAVEWGFIAFDDSNIALLLIADS